jgi:hypothetical protein
MKYPWKYFTCPGHIERIGIGNDTCKVLLFERDITTDNGRCLCWKRKSHWYRPVCFNNDGISLIQCGISVSNDWVNNAGWFVPGA